VLLTHHEFQHRIVSHVATPFENVSNGAYNVASYKQDSITVLIDV